MSYPPPPSGYPPPGGYGTPPPGAYGASPYGTPPSNNMTLAVVALVVSFCAGCVPLGIVAVVMAAQVKGKWERGDVAGAEKNARLARTLSLVSFGITALVLVVVVLLAVGGAFDESTAAALGA